MLFEPQEETQIPNERSVHDNIFSKKVKIFVWKEDFGDDEVFIRTNVSFYLDAKADEFDVPLFGKHEKVMAGYVWSQLTARESPGRFDHHLNRLKFVLVDPIFSKTYTHIMHYMCVDKERHLKENESYFCTHIVMSEHSKLAYNINTGSFFKVADQMPDFCRRRGYLVYNENVQF